MQTTVDVKVPLDLIVQALAEQLSGRLPVDRHAAMIQRLGEACTRDAAAREISVDVRTVGRMIRDGRLRAACEGSRVDVRSLADYIERRPEADAEARRAARGWRF